MTKMSEPIVFFGSGPVAAESLSILSEFCTIEAVVTKPRALHHKGSVPVLELAESLELAVHTVTDKQSLDALIRTQPFSARVGVLVDFGIIISQEVINYFPLGIVNSHFSLLPEWRGADPITFSILSGQKQTGVSLMLLTAGMDEGPLLAQSLYEIPPTMTTPELTKELVDLSGHMLKDILPLWVEDKITPAPQEAITLAPSPTPTYSRKLTKEDGFLLWEKPAEVLEREIRAFHEWPKSRAILGSIEAIITKAHVESGTGTPGKMIVVDKKPAVLCASNTLVIDRLKPAGKQEMTGEAFLAGYKQQFLG